MLFKGGGRCHYNGDKEDSCVRSEYPRTGTASCVRHRLSVAMAPRFLTFRGGMAACSGLQHQRCTEGCGLIWLVLPRMGFPA